MQIEKTKGTMTLEHFISAKELPREWDERIGDDIYLRRDFLRFVESVDSCNQNYYLFRRRDGSVDSVMMTYTRDGYNLLMFTDKKPMSIRMTFVYVPMSVTRPGIVWGEETSREVADFLRSIKGYKLALNLPEECRWQGFTQGLTCPKCMLKLRWKSLDDYLDSMRAPYRYRYNKALKKSAPLKMRWIDNAAEFDDKLYSLYEEVYSHSKVKIEKLSPAYFRGPFFKIFVLEDASGPQGFVQLLENGEELIFEFVGFCHETNHTYDTYIRMLLEIVRCGIERGFSIIDFGQTADDAKLKLGCKYTKLYALLHHSNPIVNFLCKKKAKSISYKPLDDNGFSVFKDEREGGKN